MSSRNYRSPHTKKLILSTALLAILLFSVLASVFQTRDAYAISAVSFTEQATVTSDSTGSFRKVYYDSSGNDVHFLDVDDSTGTINQDTYDVSTHEVTSFSNPPISTIVRENPVQVFSTGATGTSSPTESPSAISIDTSVGTLNWTAASNVGSSDNSYATANHDSRTWDTSTLTEIHSLQIDDFGEESDFGSVFFSEDGTKMYLLVFGADPPYDDGVYVAEFSLSIPWNSSSLTLANTIRVEGDDIHSEALSYDPRSIFFAQNGTRLYVLMRVGEEDKDFPYVDEYLLSSAWNISSASFSQTKRLLDVDSSPFGFFFKPDGTKMYVTIRDNSGDDVSWGILEYDLSIPWNIASSTLNLSVVDEESDVDFERIYFGADGGKMYLVLDDQDGVVIGEFDLFPAWNISSTLLVNVEFSPIDDDDIGLFFKPDGSKLYVVGTDGDEFYGIYEYRLGEDKNTHYLKATNFGFSIPTDSDIVISGITVEIEKKQNATGVADNAVRIVKADGSLGSANKASPSEWPLSDQYVSYGGDLWGESWAPSDINDSDFGVAISATVPAGVMASIDHIRITVEYSNNFVPEVIDDDVSTFWSVTADNSTDFQYLYGNMGGPKRISEVQLYHNNVTAIPAKVDVYVSNTTSFGSAEKTFDTSSPFTGLDGFYAFEGNANDTTTSGIDLTEFNSPTYAAGLIGQAIQFNGSDEYLQAANNTVYDVKEEDFWMAGMFMRTSDSGGNEQIIKKQFSTTQSGYRIFINSDDNLTVRIFSTAAVGPMLTDTKISTNVWYAWAFSADRDGNGILYLYNLLTNTLFTATAPINGQMGSLTTTQIFTVGRDSSANQEFFPGQMDNLIPPQIGETLTEEQFLEYVEYFKSFPQFDKLTLDEPVTGQYVKVQVNTWGSFESWSVAELDVKTVWEATENVQVSDVESDLAYFGVARNSEISQNVVGKFDLNPSGQLNNVTVESSYEPVDLVQSTSRLYTTLVDDDGNGRLYLSQIPKTYGTLDRTELTGYYRFDGNANDSGPLGYDLTAFNSPTYTTGLVNQAIEFNGSTQYLQAGSSTVYDVGTQDFWMLGMFKRTSDSGGSERIVAKRGTPLTNAAGYNVQINPTDNLSVEIGAGSTTTNVALSTVTISLNVWYTWAASFDRDSAVTIFLYNMDTGILSSTTGNISSQSGTITNTQTFTVGRASSGANGFFPGMMDNLIPPQIGQTLTQEQFLSLVYGEFLLYEGTGSVPVDTDLPIRSVVQNDGSSETIYTFFMTNESVARAVKFATATQTATLLPYEFEADDPVGDYRVIPLSGKIIVVAGQHVYELDTTNDTVTQLLEDEHTHTHEEDIVPDDIHEWRTYIHQPFTISTSTRTYTNTNLPFLASLREAYTFTPTTGAGPTQSPVWVVEADRDVDVGKLILYNKPKYYHLTGLNLVIESDTESGTSWTIKSIGSTATVSINAHHEFLQSVEPDPFGPYEGVHYMYCDFLNWNMTVPSVKLGDYDDCTAWHTFADEFEPELDPLPRSLFPFEPEGAIPVHAFVYTTYYFRINSIDDASGLKVISSLAGKDVDMRLFDLSRIATQQWLEGNCYDITILDVETNNSILVGNECANGILTKDINLIRIEFPTNWLGTHWQHAVQRTFGPDPDSSDNVDTGNSTIVYAVEHSVKPYNVSIAVSDHYISGLRTFTTWYNFTNVNGTQSIMFNVPNNQSLFLNVYDGNGKPVANDVSNGRFILVPTGFPDNYLIFGITIPAFFLVLAGAIFVKTTHSVGLIVMSALSGVMYSWNMIEFNENQWGLLIACAATGSLYIVRRYV